MGNLYYVIQLTKPGAVNTPNQSSLSEHYGNVSCVPSAPLFTPLWLQWTTKRSIFVEKGILRESKVYLRDLIINQHFLTSLIEKSRGFWSIEGRTMLTDTCRTPEAEITPRTGQEWSHRA